MANTIYASFTDAAQAEKAVGALLDYGVRNEDVTMLAHDEYGRTRTTTGDAMQNAGSHVANAGDSLVDATKSAGNRLAQAGDTLAAGTANVLGATQTAQNYQESAEDRAVFANTRSAMATNEAAVHGRTDYDTSVNTTAQASDPVAQAEHGISTTTPEDAGAGAVKGTGIGLGVGAALAIAALFVPGVGFVLGGGALASALAAGAGAAAGGVTGFLKEQGVPAEAAQHYHGAIDQGGAMIAVVIPSGKVDQATAEEVLTKYGAGNLNAY